jgi:hypothetical protein
MSQQGSSYQHQPHIFQSQPEEKWALAARVKTTKLSLAFPSDFASHSRGCPMVREARLRPEFAHLYPMLVAGAWGPAAQIAEKVAAMRLLQLAETYVFHDRILTDAHFEFRGGTPRQYLNPSQGAA